MGEGAARVDWAQGSRVRLGGQRQIKGHNPTLKRCQGKNILPLLNKIDTKFKHTQSKKLRSCGGRGGYMRCIPTFSDLTFLV